MGVSTSAPFRARPSLVQSLIVESSQWVWKCHEALNLHYSYDITVDVDGTTPLFLVPLVI